jgi:hypothetical protein
MGTFWSSIPAAQKRIVPARWILWFWPEHLVFRKDRGDGLCGYRPSHESGKFAAVVDMCYLEADDEAKAEAGYAD